MSAKRIPCPLEAALSLGAAPGGGILLPLCVGLGRVGAFWGQGRKALPSFSLLKWHVESPWPSAPLLDTAGRQDPGSWAPESLPTSAPWDAPAVTLLGVPTAYGLWSACAPCV